MCTAEDPAMTHVLGNCCTTPTATTAGWSRGLFFFLSMLNPKTSHKSIIYALNYFPALFFPFGRIRADSIPSRWVTAFTGWKLKVWSKSRMWMQHKGTTALLARRLCVCIHMTMKGSVEEEESSHTEPGSEASDTHRTLTRRAVLHAQITQWHL